MMGDYPFDLSPGAKKPRVLRLFFRMLVVLAALLVAPVSRSDAQPAPAPSDATLFQNVRIFNGKSPTLSPPSYVLVRGNTIESVSTSPINAEAGVRVIDGGGPSRRRGCRNDC